MKNYSIENRSGISIIRLQREVNLAELHAVMQEVAEQDINSCRLWDFLVGYNYTTEEIQQTASLGKQLWNENARVAILVQGQLDFGLARMLEAYRDQEGYLTRVFKTEAEALEWLELGLLEE
jgi:hypothetical protein